MARIVIVGAGVAGLAAGHRLQGAGHDVFALDKGRSPGGRLATRRIGAATLDHGAQFFTIRSDAFAAQIAPHRASGLVVEWCRGFNVRGVDATDGYPRYAVRGGMNALAKAMAVGLRVGTSTMVFAVRPADAASAHRWDVVVDDGTVHPADAVVLTCPIPQSWSLLVSAGVASGGGVPETLIRTDYDRTIALLLALDGDPMVAEPGGMQHPTDTLSFVGDNARKGVSAAPALTVHADPAWSLAHWDDPVEALTDALLAEAAPFVGAAGVVGAEVKRWRFATPQSIWAEPCHALAGAPTLVLAGDAFAGPKIEGAALSGLAAADAVIAALG